MQSFSHQAEIYLLSCFRQKINFLFNVLKTFLVLIAATSASLIIKLDIIILINFQVREF